MGSIVQDSAAINLGARAASGGQQAVGLVRVDDLEGPWTVSVWLDYAAPRTGTNAIITAPGSVVPEVFLSYRVGRSRAVVDWTTQQTAPVRNSWRSTFHASSLDVSLIIPSQTPGAVVPCTLQAWVTRGELSSWSEPGAVPVSTPATFAAQVAAGLDFTIPYGAEYVEIFPPNGVRFGGAPVAVGTMQVLWWDIQGNVLAAHLVQPQVVGVVGSYEGLRRIPVPHNARFACIESIAPAVADGVLIPVSWQVVR